MFKCDSCNKITDKYEPMSKSIVELRSKEYTNSFKRGFKIINVRSEGYEIVKEISTCSECAPIAKEQEVSTIAKYARKPIKEFTTEER